MLTDNNEKLSYQ